ncbi:MAG: DUF262 domain-containing HNH endonuclease family protein [Verrucomicrobiales bacterium]|nr:DUF262 domain-containing HNH endonuclease family protein [Verrucomicrobiales bacterium]
MNNGILPPELKSIEPLLTGDARFTVPKYQRSFAWGQDEVEELWEDILNASNRGGDYFLGTLVLHKRGNAPQEIIDGQQRLICVSMVFSAIRNVYLAANDKRAEQLFVAFLGAKDFTRDAQAHPKIVLNKINNETYLQHVIASTNLKDVEAALKDKCLHDSNKALLKAYRYLLEKITTEAASKGTRADDFLVPLIDCLRNSIKLITIPVMSEEDANLFFETLNARGKELAVSDLVKNRLYSEAGDQVMRAQQLWEKMEAELVRRPIPEFLRHFWIAKKIDAKGFNVREKQLYRMVAEDVKGQKSATLAPLKDLAGSARDYAKISDYSLWPDDDAYDAAFEQTLNDLRLFRVTQCNPILLNAMHWFDKPKDVTKVFRTVANFSFRYFIIGNQSPGNLERVSNGIAAGIRTGEYATAGKVAEAFRAINPDASFRSDFKLAVIPKARAKIARYTLAKLANFMAKQSGKSGGEQITNPDAKQVTLEHVSSQSLTAPWTKNFTKGVNPADYVYRLGNLTLLKAKVNREAADESFQNKQTIALNDSTLAINQHFKGLSQWTDIEIEKRQEELAKIAEEVWKL